MWSILFLLIPLFATWLVLQRFVAQLNILSRIGVCLLLSIMVTTWLAFLPSTVINPTLGTQLVLLFLLVTAFLLRLQWYKSGKIGNWNTWTLWPLWLCVAALLPLFAILLTTHCLQVKQGAWYSGGSTWGDLALHTTYIQYFARQEKLSLVSPIYAQVKTTYPFLFDWYTSLLYRLGSSIQTALVLTQWQALTAVVFLAMAVARTLLKKTLLIPLVLLLFFCGGGFGWWYFWGDWQVSRLPFMTYVQHQPWQYTNMPEHFIYFSNVVPDMLLPQRGFVIGLGAVLAVVLLQLHFLRTKQSGILLLSAVTTGLLPLFHFHSFLWLIGWWCCYWLFLLRQQPTKTKTFVKSLSVLLLLSAPQIWWFVANGVGSQFLSWQPGWMLTANNESAFFEITFRFFMNFGVTAIILLLLPLRLKKLWKQNPELAVAAGYSWLVFLVCLFVSFQPWPYDNIKFMMLSYFFLCMYGIFELRKIWMSGSRIIVVVLIISGTLSGALSITRELFLSSELASASDLQMGKELRGLLTPGAVTLTADQHNHPISMLVGQPIVSGYPGWLWSHGIDATATVNDVADMYAGKTNTPELLKKYTIKYVVIGEQELERLTVNQEYWKNNYALIYQNNQLRIFDVTLGKN